MGVLGVLAGSSSSDGGGAAAGLLLAVYFIVIIGLWVLMIVGMWKTFEKAGQKGWFAIIPILNFYTVIKLAGREWWWLLVIYLCACLGWIGLIIVSIDLAKAYNKSPGYGVGLGLLPFIFYPMLGFSDAEYRGPQVGPVI